MRVIKSAEDVTTLPFVDRGQQLDNGILGVDSVRKFYVAVVNKMIKIFPFHDDVLRNLAVVNPDPALRES